MSETGNSLHDDFGPPETVPWQYDRTIPERATTRSKSMLTGVGVGLSVLLVVIKGFAGAISGSTAVISDALNSLLDVVSYTALFISVRLQGEPADQTHHYGHHRAEPLAGLLIAVLAALLGGVVIRDSVLRLIDPQPVEASALTIGIVAFAIISKIAAGFMYRANARKLNSPALSAAAVDSRNDALASTVAMIGLVGGHLIDGISGLAIGVWILYSGVHIGLENIGYLMGRAPSPDSLNVVGRIAQNVSGVLDTNNIRAHYVGNFLHVEIHIEVDENLSILKAHDIAKEVGQSIEMLDDIHVAFVHTDPVPIAASDDVSTTGTVHDA
jgi:cation diffusion facilitator family transporter